MIDGNYSRVRDIIWRRSTAIAWLDYSFARVFSRSFRRTVRRIVFGERLYGGNQETIRETLFDVQAPLWLVVRTHGRRHREFPELFSLPEYRHATVIRLQTPRAGEEFLAGGEGAGGIRVTTRLANSSRIAGHRVVDEGLYAGRLLSTIPKKCPPDFTQELPREWLPTRTKDPKLLM